MRPAGALDGGSPRPDRTDHVVHVDGEHPGIPRVVHHPTIRPSGTVIAPVPSRPPLASPAPIASRSGIIVAWLITHPLLVPASPNVQTGKWCASMPALGAG